MLAATEVSVNLNYCIAAITGKNCYLRMQGYYGNYEELNIHGYALQKMVKMRGGLQNLKSDTALR